MGLLETIKVAGMQAVDSTNPVNLLFATVLSVEPVSVKVDQRFTLTSEFLIVPERLIRHEIDITHAHQYQDQSGSSTSNRTTNTALYPIVIRTGLMVGDSVLLLRVQGGQKYVILDKVVNVS